MKKKLQKTTKRENSVFWKNIFLGILGQKNPKWALNDALILILKKID